MDCGKSFFNSELDWRTCHTDERRNGSRVPDVTLNTMVFAATIQAGMAHIIFS